MPWDPVTLFEAIEDSVAVYEPDGTFVYVNAATERILGHPRDQLIGTRIWERLPNMTGGPFLEVFQRVRETGRSETFEHHHVQPDRWYRSRVHALDGRIHVVSTDITESKHAELRSLGLSRASHVFSRVTDVDELLQEVARLLADILGDGCTVRALDPAGAHLRVVAMHHADPEELRARRTALAGQSAQGEDSAARVFGTGAPLFLPVVDPDAHRRASMDDAHCGASDRATVHSEIAVPLGDGERRIGVISMTRDRTPRAYTAADLSLLGDLADRAGMAVARARLYEQAKLGTRRASALAAASRAFGSVERDPRGILELLVRVAAEEVGECAVASTLSEDGMYLDAVAVHHADAELVAELRTLFQARTPLAGSISERVLVTRKPLRIARVDVDAFAASARPEFAETIRRLRPRSFILVPIEVGGRPQGTLSVSRMASTSPYDDADQSLLEELAERASLALENARVLQAERRSRQAAETAALRTARLQQLTALLAKAVTPRDATQAICREAGNALGAAAAFVWFVSPDGRRLELVETEGYEGPALDGYRVIPLDAALPITDALRRREIVYLGDPRTRARVYPMLGEGASAGFRAWAAIPLASEEEAFGAFVLSFREERAFNAEDYAFLRTLAQLCTQTIVRTRLFEAEQASRASAERVAEQTRRLQAVTSHLSRRRPAREIAETVLRESVAALSGSSAAIWLLDPAGEHLELLASVGYQDPVRFARLPLGSSAPVCAAVEGGAPIYLSNSEEYGRAFPTSKAQIEDVAPADFAMACVPLTTEGRVVGGLAFAFLHAHVFLDDERTFLEVLADQCAQALDRARLLEQERAASAAHAEANRTLNAIISASPAAIMLLDLDGTVRLWNPAAERIFGWSADEALGQLLPAIIEEHRDEFRRNLAKVGAGLPIAGTETRRVTRDGRVIDVSLWAAPVYRPDGIVQCLSVVVDITDRKRAEEAARAADRRKDEFLAMLGHELRNPLAPIMTALQLMTLKRVSGGEREREIIERQTRHLVRLVDDLLDISRITRGKVELRRTRTDLGAVLARAVEMASPLLEQRNHRLEIAAPQRVHYVDGDEFRLAQVFQNLLTNAAKYTPPGGRVAVRLAASDGSAVVEVEDDGEGIPAHLLPSIFEPFVQGERSLDRSEGGLGLGLALVRSLVALHGGTVAAHSEGVGKGSRFVVSLPSTAEAEQVATEGPAGAGDAESVGRRRVLLVDDNQDAAEMLAALLRSAGHEVLVTHDGPAALAEARTFRPDVALLDIGLPVMDGYELARRLKGLSQAPLHLVALTGYGQEHDRLRCLEAGFEEHLVKPVDGQRLLAVVNVGARRLATT